MGMDSIPGRVKEFLLSTEPRLAPVAHPAFCPIGTGCYFLERKADGA